jgi:predicted nucleic-acid-binding Zn-ribbon protein
MAKVTIKCTWQEESGDHWPPQYCTTSCNVKFDVTCLCGGNKFNVRTDYPDFSGVYRMKYSNTPYSMVTCKKCGTTDMLYSGEGEPRETTIILDASKTLYKNKSASPVPLA